MFLWNLNIQFKSSRPVGIRHPWEYYCGTDEANPFSNFFFFDHIHITELFGGLLHIFEHYTIYLACMFSIFLFHSLVSLLYIFSDASIILFLHFLVQAAPASVMHYSSQQPEFFSRYFKRCSWIFANWSFGNSQWQIMHHNAAIIRKDTCAHIAN